MCRSTTLATLAALMLTGCASTFYKDGKQIAKIPYLSEGTMTTDGTTVTSKPGKRTVDAITTVTLAVAPLLIREAPAVTGKIADAFSGQGNSN